jgi:hypothetical protein
MEAGTTAVLFFELTPEEWMLMYNQPSGGRFRQLTDIHFSAAGSQAGTCGVFTHTSIGTYSVENSTAGY